MERKLLSLFFVLSLCFSLSSVPATCSASGTQMYEITEPELIQLQADLNRLQTINDDLQQICGRQRNELVTLQADLMQARKQLTEAQNRSAELQMQIQSLTMQSQKQEASLKEINKSFREYEQEQKRTRIRIKAQRNTWEVAAGILAAGLALK